MDISPTTLATRRSLLDGIVEKCGKDVLVAPKDAAQRVLPARGLAMPQAPILRPANTEEVALIVRNAAAAGQVLIPLGGGTGLVGGLSQVTGREWYLSLERMRAIERIDPLNRTVVVEAGLILQILQESLREEGFAFGVDLGARGSAQIGGLIATNAGGERAIRHGMMRDQVLGIEVVTGDGVILDLMSEVRKNNVGYDLKQLFIGSEGTLGIVTRAVLKIRPAYRNTHSAFVTLKSTADIAPSFELLGRKLGDTISAYEVMWPEFVATIAANSDNHNWVPQTPDAAVYILVDQEDFSGDSEGELFLEALGELLDRKLVLDAIIARSEAERQSFWRFRNDVPTLASALKPMVTFDVSIASQDISEYVEEVRQLLGKAAPRLKAVYFGHFGDNNVHICVDGGDAYGQARNEIHAAIYGGVIQRSGSISAEHGIGVEKREVMASSISQEAILIMKKIKEILDTRKILNTGKIF